MCISIMAIRLLSRHISFLHMLDGINLTLFKITKSYGIAKVRKTLSLYGAAQRLKVISKTITPFVELAIMWSVLGVVRRSQ